MVIGSAAVDVISQANIISDTDGSRGRHSTSPGTVGLHLGGVGRNVAEAAYRISTSKFQARPSATVLVSSVGDDSLGRLLLEETQRMGMRTDGIRVMTTHQRSAVCNMILNGSGNLIGGVADMDIVRSIEPEMVRQCIRIQGWETNSQTQVISHVNKHDPALVAMDANVSPDVLRAVIQHCNAANITSESLAYGWSPSSMTADIESIFYSFFVSLRRCFTRSTRIDVQQRAYFRDQVRVNYACHFRCPGIEFSRFSCQICLP